MLDFVGGPQYGGMLDYPDDQATQWDSDWGTKNRPGCRWNSGHMRIYATSGGGRNYNTTYGFYVAATVHEDRESLFWCDDQYRSREIDEDWWVERIEDNLGTDTDYDWTVEEPGFNWNNDVTGTLEISPNDSDTHQYQSDGLGVNVRLPNDD